MAVTVGMQGAARVSSGDGGIESVSVTDEHGTTVAATALAFPNATLTDAGSGTARVSTLTTEEVTTGASPINADPDVTITAITTGGTGTVEYIVLPDPSLPIAGFLNVEKIGTIHVLYLAHRTGVEDFVRVNLRDGIAIVSYDDAGNTLQYFEDSSVDLRNVGEFVFFKWTGYLWYFVNSGGTDTLPSVFNASAALFTWGHVNTQIVRGEPGGPPRFVGDQGANTLQRLGINGLSDAIDGSYRSWSYTTNGDGGTEIIDIPSPTHIRNIGFRQLFYIEALTDPGDEVSIDTTNMKTSDGSGISSIVLDSVDEYLFFEAWDADTWRVIRGTATVTPT